MNLVFLCVNVGSSLVKKCSTLVGDVHNGEGLRVWEQAMYKKSLSLPLKLVVNLNLSKHTALFKIM